MAKLNVMKHYQKINHVVTSHCGSILTVMFLSCVVVGHAQAVPDPVSLPAAAPLQDFTSWLNDVRKEAEQQGIRRETLDTAFNGLELSKRVVALDRGQPEVFVKSNFHRYLVRHLTNSKIIEGQTAKADNIQALKEAERQFGVPAEVIVGIWGQETHFGKNIGSFPVIKALASLAYDGRRASMFHSELLAALTMLDKGDVGINDFVGSWAGAFGQSQFMPTSYLKYAVNSSGGGKADIWSDKADVFASIGNFLKSSGWVAGQSWGLSVHVPANFNAESMHNPNVPELCNKALSKHSVQRQISAWKADGFTTDDVWPADDVMAALVVPEGATNTEAYLVLSNYRSILSYNCSNFYALSVLLLADAVH